jgi:hypothetical protein
VRSSVESATQKGPVQWTGPQLRCVDQTAV